MLEVYSDNSICSYKFMIYSFMAVYALNNLFTYLSESQIRNFFYLIIQILS